MTAFTPFDALIPEAFVVVGVRLMPFTLGHAALLMRLGGECWIEGGMATADELFLGVTVCSSKSFLQFQKDIFSGRHQARIDAVAAQVKIGDMQAESELFSRYVTEGMRGPKLLVEDGNTVELRSHMIQSLRVQLMTFFRVPERDVMDVPVSVALWDMATLAEMRGVGRIWGKEDDELKEQANEFDRKYREKMGLTANGR